MKGEFRLTEYVILQRDLVIVKFVRDGASFHMFLESSSHDFLLEYVLKLQQFLYLLLTVFLPARQLGLRRVLIIPRYLYRGVVLLFRTQRKDRLARFLIQIPEYVAFKLT